MIGFQRSDQPADDDTSFNFGIGLIVDPNAKTLGSGLRRNRPLPDGETTIRTQTEPELGVFFMTSFAFN